VTRSSRELSIGDLALTHDMGTSSGLIAMIVGKGHHSNPAWMCYDIILDGKKYEGVDEDFLVPLETSSHET